MEGFGKFLIFLGVVLVIIGVFSPGIVSSEDPEKGYIGVLIGVIMIIVGYLMKKAPPTKKKSGLDLQTDEPPRPASAFPAGQPIEPAALTRSAKAAPILENVTIKSDYSYARDKLTAHIHQLSSEVKTMEILDDIVGVVDEYAYSLKMTKVSAWDFLEIAQNLAENKHAGFARIRGIEAEAKIMRPLLAGMKSLVLVGDCGISKEEIPDSVSQILEIDGPPEVDAVVRYLLSQFG